MKTILTLLLFLWPGMLQDPAAQQDPEKKPSLAEIARQSREKRFRAERAVRTITNADLQELRGARVSSARKAETPDQETEAGNTDQGEDQQDEESSPELEQLKQAFNEARLNLKNAVNNTLVLELKMNNLRNAFFREDDGNTQARIQSEMDETFRALETSRKEVDGARKVIEKLQKEARGLGLTPGAIRRLTGELPEPASILSDTTPTP